MTTHLLIDADVLAYRAGFATDKTKYCVTWNHLRTEGTFLFDDAKAAKEEAAKTSGALVWSRKETEPEDKALMLIDIMLGDIRARYESERPTLHCYLTGIGNYRHGIATRASYKGNRSGQQPPAHLKAIRAHLVNKHGAILSAGEEADDLLGIAANQYAGAVIVSVDKDLLQIPGRHYDFVKKEK